jgi:His-Xaa-Ser system protein HxsD
MEHRALPLGPGSIAVEFDETLYPLDAVYGAAYVFIDRAYVHLDRVADKRLSVTFKAKRDDLDVEALAGDFQNELLGQAWRRRIVDDSRTLVESITARALAGAAGPPGLDELLAADIGDATAFEDPLGIAMSWEEKYLKKKQGAEGEPAGEAASDAATEVPSKGEGSDQP